MHDTLTLYEQLWQWVGDYMTFQEALEAAQLLLDGCDENIIPHLWTSLAGHYGRPYHQRNMRLTPEDIGIVGDLLETHNLLMMLHDQATVHMDMYPTAGSKKEGRIAISRLSEPVFQVDPSADLIRVGTENDLKTMDLKKRLEQIIVLCSYAKGVSWERVCVRLKEVDLPPHVELWRFSCSRSEATHWMRRCIEWRTTAG